MAAPGIGPNGAAPNANDCLALLSSAVSSPTDQDRKRHLSHLLALLEASPGFLPILYGTFVGMLGGPVGGAGVVRRWVAEVMELAVCRGPLGPDQRMQLAIQSMEPLHRLMATNDPSDALLNDTKKLAIQVLSTSYPLIFRSTLSPSSPQTVWGLTQQLKGIVLGLWRNEATTLGVRIAGTKFVQKIIQVGTRTASDPRRRGEDPQVGMVPANHRFLRAKELETEATALLEEAVRLLYSSRSPDLVSALITVLGFLVRTRPSHGKLIITALTSWSPKALSPSLPSNPTSPLLQYTLLRGPEKTLRITLFLLERLLSSLSLEIHHSLIREALALQAQRMDSAGEKARWERERLAGLKRQKIMEDVEAVEAEAVERKRVKLSHHQGHQQVAQTSGQAGQGGQAPQNLLPGFDVTTLPVELVVELIVANFQVLSDQALQDAIQRIRSGASTGLAAPGVPPQPAPRPDDEDAIERLEFKQEPESRLDGKLGPQPGAEGDVKVEDDAPEEPEDDPAALLSEEFELPPPVPLDEDERSDLLRATLERIAESGMETMKGRMGASAGATGQAEMVDEVWVAMLARLATRGMASGKLEAEDARDLERTEEEERRREQVRQIIFDFIIADLQNRLEFARIWLNEEWFAHRAGSPPQDMFAEDRSYNRWLRRLLDHILLHSKNDRSFAAFMIDLPEIPIPEIRRLEGMCGVTEQRHDAFTTLRDLALLRPPARQAALDVLLGLTTHSAKATRNAAIVLVRSWVPDTEPLSSAVTAFARQLLERLQAKVELPLEESEGKKDEDEAMELEAGEELPEEESCAVVENGEVTSGLPPARSQESVRQYLELLFGLSMKSPDLLDDLFMAYEKMPSHVQEAIPVLMAPLVRSLGPKNAKIVSLIEGCPPGADDLVLRVISTLTEKGRAPPILVEAIKTLASKRNISPRFIVPIIADFSKADIVNYLPRVLSLLDGTQANKTLIRGIFESIIEMPPQNFGAVSTNAPRVKQSELLTPVELMALLHRSEKDAGLKQAIEAINICFSMTDVFRPEVLAAFMQQIVDELTLPTLFLRTVIQAVQTYKSLQAFVSTTLLSRLIIKKIWTQPQLWEGFIRCAKTIAPHSFGALLQLPREQLREVITKQPALKAPLRDYVVKKAGSNKARVAPMLEILSDQSSMSPQPDGLSRPRSDGTQSPVPAIG